MRLAALAILSIALAPLPASPETRAHLAGSLDADAGLVPFTPYAAEAEPVGTFTLDGREGGDLRAAPGTLVLTTPTGALTAVAAIDAPRYGPRRVDPKNGRPLRLDASADAVCTTGGEPGCWRSGDPLPGSREVFDALCRATRFVSTPDGLRCQLELLGDDAELQSSGASYASTLASVTAGNPGAATAWGASFVTALNVDPCDAFRDDGAGSCTQAASDPSDPIWAADGPTLNAVLTDAQEALLGCGPFWGSDCEVDGIDLFRAEGGALSNPWADSSEAERDDAGEAVILPGARGVADLGYDAAVDGCSTPDAGPACADAAVLVPPPSVATDAPFESEMSAAAWNFYSVFEFVLQSTVPPPPATSPPSGSQIGCGGCAQIGRRDYLEYPFFTRLLDDDPSGLPLERWVWESGAPYAITEATGDLAAFAGGTAYVLGPEVPRVAPPRPCILGPCAPPPTAPTIGVPIVLVAPEGASPDPSSPFVERGVGPDGELGTADDVVLPIAFAYGVVPEPDTAPLAGAAMLALAVLAGAQPSPRLRRMRGSGGEGSGSKARPVTCSYASM